MVTPNGHNANGNGRITGKQRKISERSLANLKPFPKGVSGNPDGRPKGESLTAALRRILSEPVVGPSMNKGEDFIRRVLEFAGRGGAGDAAYAKEVIERIDGKVPTRIANADGSNIEFVDRSTWDKV